VAVSVTVNHFVSVSVAVVVAVVHASSPPEAVIVPVTEPSTISNDVVELCTPSVDVADGTPTSSDFVSSSVVVEVLVEVPVEAASELAVEVAVEEEDSYPPPHFLHVNTHSIAVAST